MLTSILIFDFSVFWWFLLSVVTLMVMASQSFVSEMQAINQVGSSCSSNSSVLWLWLDVLLWLIAWDHDGSIQLQSALEQQWIYCAAWGNLYCDENVKPNWKFTCLCFASLSVRLVLAFLVFGQSKKIFFYIYSIANDNQRSRSK